MASLRVGLTGGLASGKSTVARRFAEAGFTVVDADQLVADLYRPGEPGAAAVAGLFGDQALRPDGAVDKVAVARRAFADPELLHRLEAAVHPLVRERFARIADATDGVAVLEATLLVEAGYAPDFDRVVTVEAPAELRLRRAVARGLAEDEARARLAAQPDGTERRAAAHTTIQNAGDLGKLEIQVAQLIREILHAARDREAGIAAAESADSAAPADPAER
jgi:dephospho-CoA kinase